MAVKYVGLIVFRGQSVWECSTWLTQNPFPAWEAPYEWGIEDIAACSGPFRIVPWRFDDEDEDEWCVIAEHDTERPGPRHADYYGKSPLEIADDEGLKYAIKAIIARDYGTRSWQDDDETLEEILRLIEYHAAICELERYVAQDQAEYEARVNPVTRSIDREV